MPHNEELFLLDTHVWIWLAEGSKNISMKNQAVFRQAILRDSVYVAAISVWEISMLVAKQRIILDMPLPEWVNKSFEALRLKLIPLSPQISIDSCFLPGTFHGDPADRMIVSTARVENLCLATKDQNIIAFGRGHHVKVMAAS